MSTVFSGVKIQKSVYASSEVSDEEGMGMDDLYVSFRVMDKDGSGTLTLREWRDYFGEVVTLQKAWKALSNGAGVGQSMNLRDLAGKLFVGEGDLFFFGGF